MALLFMGLLFSCTVKEDRLECPCFLTLDFSEVEASRLMEDGYRRMDVLISDGGECFDENSWNLGESVREYSVSVPRSGADIMAVCSGEGCVLTENGLVMEEGTDCPEIYMFAESYIPFSSEEREYVTLHKNYCKLSVCMKTAFDIPARPFRVKVVGRINGYSLDGSPREGFFSYFSSPSREGLCYARIPRQTDGSLKLEVDFLDSDEVRIFPVGEYIVESGYDWNATDLEDVCVEMDFSRTGAALAISQWKKTLSFDLSF